MLVTIMQVTLSPEVAKKYLDSILPFASRKAREIGKNHSQIEMDHWCLGPAECCNFWPWSHSLSLGYCPLDA